LALIVLEILLVEFLICECLFVSFAFFRCMAHFFFVLILSLSALRRWSFMGLAVNEFEGTTFSCEDFEEGDGCITSGEEVLRNLSFNNGSTQKACLGLLALIAGFHVLAYTVLRVNKRKYQTYDKIA